MNSTDTIDSAALFFEPQREAVVAGALVTRIVEACDVDSARPLLFTASGGGFQLDDCYLYSDDANGIELWDTPIPNRKKELLEALRSGAITSISFNVPLQAAMCRSEWRFNFYVHPGFGRIYWGTLASPKAKRELLLESFEIASRFFDVRYGFAYSMPLRDEPDCYAYGSPRLNFAGLRQWLTMRSTGADAPLAADECWRRELEGPKRHLTGLFRDAYPLNVVSSAHVRRAALESAGIGSLEQLDESRWLWEIDEEYLSDASAYLAKNQSLVRQYYT